MDDRPSKHPYRSPMELVEDLRKVPQWRIAAKLEETIYYVDRFLADGTYHQMSMDRLWEWHRSASSSIREMRTMTALGQDVVRPGIFALFVLMIQSFYERQHGFMTIAFASVLVVWSINIWFRRMDAVIDEYSKRIEEIRVIAIARGLNQASPSFPQIRASAEIPSTATEESELIPSDPGSTLRKKE